MWCTFSRHMGRIFFRAVSAFSCAGSRHRHALFPDTVRSALRALAASLLSADSRAMWFFWPVRVFLEGAESLARIFRITRPRIPTSIARRKIEALVEAAEEEGIIESGTADLIRASVSSATKRFGGK